MTRAARPTGKLSGRMTLPSPRHCAVVLGAGLTLLLPASALAAPPPRDASPDALREYVRSGAYLADVEAAAAPARAQLLARLDEIDAQRTACVAAGLTAPGASVRAAPVGAVAQTGLSGTTTLTLRAGALRGARTTASGGATASARTLRFPASRALLTTSKVVIYHRGAVRLTRGGRAGTLRDVRLTLRPGSGRLTGDFGGRRVTLLALARGRGATTLSPSTGTARVTAAPATLTRAGARTLRRIGLRAGRVGSLSSSVRIARSGIGTPSTPAPTTTTTSTATTTTTAAPATPVPVPTPTVPAPTPTAPAPAFTPTAAACATVPTKTAIVLDIDETAMSNYLGRAGQQPFAGDPGGGSAGQFPPAIAGTDIALAPVKALYDLATSRGAMTFFVTARPTAIQPQTLSNLTEQGYGADPQVTFKANLGDDSGTYKRDARQDIEAQGYTILQNVGDQCTDLFGGAAERQVKLPNPFYLSGGSGAPPEGEQDDAVCGPLT